jgi:2-haloalkanoic acid dehalogenase type II
LRLTDFSTLTFDCYGTLIDWESGIMAGLKPLIDQMDGRLDRDAILQAHARQESTQQRVTPSMRYSDLLATVYRNLAAEWGLPVTPDEAAIYGASVEHWPAFADSAEALAYLKQHFNLVILSNVDRASFAYSNARLGITFDEIYTAEDAGSYKPSDRNFEYMIEQLAARDIAKGEILHTAESMFHDHAPANRHGLHNCWIYRRHDQKGFGATRDPGDMPHVDFRFDSMADLVAAHQAELAG